MKKRNILKLAAVLLPLIGITGSCSDKEDIVFDHEQAAFEIQSDKILLEVIPAPSTADEEDIYIVGAFNGMDDETVIGNGKYMLTPSTTVKNKRGIYISPADFVNGKTLADGYHFVSSKQRNEVTALGETVNRTIYPSVGTRTNIYVTKWAAFFDSAHEVPTHDGFVVYVDNQTTWTAISLYMWGDVNNLNGDWPGMLPTGTQVIDGTTYTYFDMGADNTGLNENLIFNNGGGGMQLADFNYTIDHDVYLRITDSGLEEISGGSPEPPAAPGYKLYVDNQTGWANVAMYVWGDTELFGGWPGALPSRTAEIDGVTYQVWNIGDNGATYNPILNDNGAGSQVDGPQGITATRDYYYKVTATGWEEIK